MEVKHSAAIGVLTCLALMVATVPVVTGSTSGGVNTASVTEDVQTYMDSLREFDGNTADTIAPKNGIGCGGDYEIWAVDENDDTIPIVIAEGKKVLMGTGLFENIEGNYGLPDGLGIDYGPLRDFLLDTILYLSDNPDARVALYDPDPIADGFDGWDEIYARMSEWPGLDDWSLNPSETLSFEMVVSEWVSSGAIQFGAQIEDVADLYSISGDLAYDVLIIDQGGQSNTPDYDSLSNAIQVYLASGGGVIVSAYSFIDWASFFEVDMKPGVQHWYEGDMNDQFLQDLFPGVKIIKERDRQYMGNTEWFIKDYATNAEVTLSAPSSETTLFSRGGGLHGFLRLEVPPDFEVEIDFDPDTLNKDSNGRWVTVYLETPSACDPRDIDPNTILLNDVLTPVLDPHYGWVRSEDSYIMDHDGDGLWERMVKFVRGDVSDILPVGYVITVTVTGSTYSGVDFSGSDVIRVIELNVGKNMGSFSTPDRTDSWIVLSRYI
jgi:hypothetical protein